MIIRSFLITLLIFTFSGIKGYGQTIAKTPTATIVNQVIYQEAAWNKGDLKNYLNTYWNSDSLVYIGKRGVINGWKNLSDNYKKNFPTADQMGKLELEVLSVDMFSGKLVYVTGKWKLHKKNTDNSNGYFTQLWMLKNGKWVIISDHTNNFL